MPIPAEYICPINNGPIFISLTHNCGQSFERDILNELLDKNAADNLDTLCPSCNQKILTKSLTRNLDLEEKILMYLVQQKSIKYYRNFLVIMLPSYKLIREALINYAIAKADSIAANLRVSLSAEMARIPLEREYFESNRDFELASQNRYELDSAQNEHIVVYIRRVLKTIFIHLANKEADLQITNCIGDCIKRAQSMVKTNIVNAFENKTKLEQEQSLMLHQYSEFHVYYDRFKQSSILEDLDTNTKALHELADLITETSKTAKRLAFLVRNHYSTYYKNNYP